MIALVRIALRRPYTFVVAAMLVTILGIVQILRMPTDIFPVVDIPVVSVAFNYTGMPAEEMEKRVVAQFERFLQQRHGLDIPPAVLARANQVIE
jgi:multidrug efflux pump subunit AcrB